MLSQILRDAVHIHPGIAVQPADEIVGVLRIPDPHVERIGADALRVEACYLVHVLVKEDDALEAVLKGFLLFYISDSKWHVIVCEQDRSTRVC